MNDGDVTWFRFDVPPIKSRRYPGWPPAPSTVRYRVTKMTANHLRRMYRAARRAGLDATQVRILISCGILLGRQDRAMFQQAAAS